MCAQMRYQIGAFPNFKQQFSPDEANNELVDFTQLLNSKCSNALIYLLCSVYAPYCYNTTEKNVVRTKALPPCRSLCEYVSEGCANVVREQGHIWPPGPHLNCSNYPTSGLCFGPSDPSTLPVIDIITGILLMIFTGKKDCLTILLFLQYICCTVHASNPIQRCQRCVRLKQTKSVAQVQISHCCQGTTLPAMFPWQ